MIHRQNIGKGCLIALLILVVVLIAGIVSYQYFRAQAPSPENGTTYRILFEDSKGLEAGDVVTLQGVKVGRVESVERDQETGRVAVEVLVDSQSSGRIPPPPNTSARLISEGWIWERTRVQLLTRGESAESIEEGVTVEGLENWAAEQAWRGREKAQQGIRAVVETAEESLGNARQWAESPEARELRSDIESLRAELRQMGGDAALDAQSKAQKLLSEGRQLTDRLMQFGREDLASDLESTFLELRDRLRKSTSELERSVQSETAEESEGVIIMASPTPSESPSPTPVPVPETP